MARRRARPRATQEQSLEATSTACPSCGQPMWAAYTNHRTLVTLTGLLRLHLAIRRCPHADCPRYHRPYRPEAEGRLALPHHEFGLDVIALIGALRYVQHQSVPEMHRTLQARGVDISQRSVTYLLERYDELLALSLTDTERLREITAQIDSLKKQGRQATRYKNLSAEIRRLDDQHACKEE